MRYLIDTNVLANIVEDKYISNDVRAIIGDYDNQIFISSESVKEFIHLVQEKRILLGRHWRNHDIFDLIENEYSLQIKYVTEEHLRTRANLRTPDLGQL
jgi:PIN domain nuclease of toxin-antitoxin system